MHTDPLAAASLLTAMPTETVTVHPSGLSLVTSAQAWYLRDKQQWKWKDIRAEVRNVQRKVPSFQAVRNAVGHAEAVGEVQGQRVRPLRQVRPRGRRAPEISDADNPKCICRHHLVPEAQRATTDKSRRTQVGLHKSLERIKGHPHSQTSEMRPAR